MPEAAEQENASTRVPGTFYLRTALVLALVGIAVPLLFGPVVFTLGLAARDKGHPRAWIALVAGVILFVYGVVYYRLAVTNGLR